MLPLLLIALCVVLRIVPHPPNFAPVGGSAVFAGRTLPAGVAVATTLFAMLVGDFALSRLHGYPMFTAATPFVYGGLAVQALIGRSLRNRRGGAVLAAMLGALAFFILSNFGVWVGGLYGHSFSGLLLCYAAAIPFFGWTIASDILWTVALMAIYRASVNRLPARGRWIFPGQPAEVKVF